MVSSLLAEKGESNMNAIQFLQKLELSESGSQNDLRDLVISAVNETAELNDCQQNFVRMWFTLNRLIHGQKIVGAICSLATYINTCHS